MLLMPANLSLDSNLAGLMINSDTPNWLSGRARWALTSSSSLLPGNIASTSSGVMPSFRPLSTGAAAIVSEQFELLSVELVGCSDGLLAGVLPFADEESADLFGTQAAEIPIKTKAIRENDFMLLMMPWEIIETKY